MYMVAFPDSCQAEETPLHYKWPESRPSVTYFIPCFPYKEQNASRTWCVDDGFYTITIHDCTDYGPNDFPNHFSCVELVCKRVCLSLSLFLTLLLTSSFSPCLSLAFSLSLTLSQPDQPRQFLIILGPARP